MSIDDRAGAGALPAVPEAGRKLMGDDHATGRMVKSEITAAAGALSAFAEVWHGPKEGGKTRQKKKKERRRKKK
jgi:hypothetical protein